MRYYLTNFINNIKTLFTKDLNIEGLKSDILTLNKRIDFIHKKLEEDINK